MNNKGVTLIELLIVIVVLGIIAAFSIPAVGNVITNAEKDSVVEDARAIESAARIYCGSRTCTTEELAGITFNVLAIEVFDETLYVETDGEDPTDPVAVYNAGTGEWTVTLTADPTNGTYGFVGVPSSSNRDQVTE